MPFREYLLLDKGSYMRDLIPVELLPFAIITLDLNYNIINTNSFFKRHLNPVNIDEFQVGANFLLSSVDDKIVERLMEGNRLNCDQLIFWKDCTYPIPLICPTMAKAALMALQVNIVYDDAVIYIISVDVTNEVISTIEYEKTAKKLLDDSHKCPLTNLYNRRFLIDHLNKVKGSSSRNGEIKKHIFMLFDIDHFKSINDQYGHNIGDEALCEFSNRMLATFRSEDVVCRLGGEEFLVFLPISPNKTETLAILSRIFVAINEKPFSMSSGVDLAITFSAGLHVFSSNDCIEDAINQADSLMYQAKADGRNRSYYQLESNMKPQLFLMSENQ